MNIHDKLLAARQAQAQGDIPSALRFASAVLRKDLGRVEPLATIEALTIYGTHAPSRAGRLRALREAYAIAQKTDGHSIRAGDIDVTIGNLMVTLADELATGTRREVMEAIEIMEVMAGDSYLGKNFAFHRIAMWCAENGMFQRGLPWAALAAAIGSIEGLLWGALYMADVDSHVAQNWLREAFDQNPHIGPMLAAETAPELPADDSHHLGSPEEAACIAATMHAGWRKGAHRIEDLFEDILFEYQDSDEEDEPANAAGPEVFVKNPVLH